MTPATPSVRVCAIDASRSWDDQVWTSPPEFDLDANIATQLTRLFPQQRTPVDYVVLLADPGGEYEFTEAGWAISADGAVVSIGGYPPIDTTVRDVLRAHSEGLIDGDPSVVYLRIGAGGRGNGIITWHQIASFAEDEFARVVFDSACVALAGYAKKHALRAWKGRRRNAVQDVWVDSQGLISPLHIRIFLDTRNCWDPKTVSRRLRVTRKFAKWLLTEVGYQPAYKGAPWCRADEPEALRHRADWIEMERRYPGAHNDDE